MKGIPKLSQELKIDKNLERIIDESTFANGIITIDGEKKLVPLVNYEGFLYVIVDGKQKEGLPETNLSFDKLDTDRLKNNLFLLKYPALAKDLPIECYPRDTVYRASIRGHIAECEKLGLNTDICLAVDYKTLKEILKPKYVIH